MHLTIHNIKQQEARIKALCLRHSFLRASTVLSDVKSFFDYVLVSKICDEIPYPH
jgi:hypothetical protein